MNNLIIDTSTNSLITFDALLDRLNIIYTALTPGLLAVCKDSLKRYNQQTDKKIYIVEAIEQVNSDVPEQYGVIEHIVEVVPGDLGHNASIKVVYGFNYQLLGQRWKKVRDIRDSLLSKVDWVESSSAVSAKSKEAIKAYKQLLRDLPSLYKYPEDVVYPDIPAVQYKRTSKQSSEELSTEEYLVYKSSNNMNFISNWKKFNFTSNRKIVELLLSTYA